MSQHLLDVTLPAIAAEAEEVAREAEEAERQARLQAQLDAIRREAPPVGPSGRWASY